MKLPKTAKLKANNLLQRFQSWI